jgi:hypothetical protein
MKKNGEVQLLVTQCHHLCELAISPLLFGCRFIRSQGKAPFSDSGFRVYKRGSQHLESINIGGEGRAGGRGEKWPKQCMHI